MFHFFHYFLIIISTFFHSPLFPSSRSSFERKQLEASNSDLESKIDDFFNKEPKKKAPINIHIGKNEDKGQPHCFEIKQGRRGFKERLPFNKNTQAKNILMPILLLENIITKINPNSNDPNPGDNFRNICTKIMRNMSNETEEKISDQKYQLDSFFNCSYKTRIWTGGNCQSLIQNSDLYKKIEPNWDNIDEQDKCDIFAAILDTNDNLKDCSTITDSIFIEKVKEDIKIFEDDSDQSYYDEKEYQDHKEFLELERCPPQNPLLTGLGSMTDFIAQKIDLKGKCYQDNIQSYSSKPQDECYTCKKSFAGGSFKKAYYATCYDPKTQEWNPITVLKSQCPSGREVRAYSDTKIGLLKTNQVIASIEDPSFLTLPYEDIEDCPDQNKNDLSCKKICAKQKRYDGTLTDTLRNLIDLNERKDIAKELLKGVISLIEARKFHGDLKLDNIFMEGNKPKIADLDGADETTIKLDNIKRHGNRGIMTPHYIPGYFWENLSEEKREQFTEMDLYAADLFATTLMLEVTLFNDRTFFKKMDNLYNRTRDINSLSQNLLPKYDTEYPIIKHLKEIIRNRNDETPDSLIQSIKEVISDIDQIKQ